MIGVAGAVGGFLTMLTLMFVGLPVAVSLFIVGVLRATLYLGIREGAHVGITTLVQYLPPARREMLRRALSLIAAVMLVIVFYEAINVARLTWSERLGVVRITSSVFFLPIIFGALHSALHLLLLAFGPAPAAGDSFQTRQVQS